MAKSNSSAGGGSASCSTEQTGNVASLSNRVRWGDDRSATEEQRRDVANDAAYEIDSVAEHLLRLEVTAEDWHVFRALCMRLKQLACIQMSAFDDGAETMRSLTRRLSGDIAAQEVSND